jgi:hypothetical protein
MRMNGPMLFLTAILTPFFLVAALLLPVYAAVFGATYIVYYPQTGSHPLALKWDDVFYIIDIYSRLAEYWLNNITQVSFVDYTLPVVVLPIVGLVAALYITIKVTRGLLHLFQASSSH